MKSWKTMLAWLGLGLCLSQPGIARPSRPFQVADAIELTKVAGSPIYSPDGRRCVFVTSSGNLKQDTVHYRLYLCDAQLQLRLVAELQSSSNRPAVENPRWLNDNRTVTFLGERPGEKHQAYALDCDSGVLTSLVGNPQRHLMGYAVTEDRSSLAYVTVPLPQPLFDDVARRQGVVATELPLPTILADKDRDRDWADDTELYVQHGNVTTRVTVPDRLSFDNGDLFQFSPDKRYLLFDTRVVAIPPGWRGYQDRILQAKLSAQRAPGEAAAIWRYYLLDLSDGSIKPLMDAPHEGQPTIQSWNGDAARQRRQSLRLGL